MASPAALSEWNVFLTRHPLNQNTLATEGSTLDRLVREHGVAMVYRAELWPQMAGAYVLRNAANANANASTGDGTSSTTYAAYLARAAALPESATKPIVKDAPRTFPDLPQMQGKEAALIHVLSAFSARNAEVGYVQGFNFVVAVFLLTGMSEEMAFWLFVATIERILPADFYTGQMVGVHVEQQVLNLLVHTRFQKLAKVLDAYNIQLQFISTAWFITGFASNAPLETTMRIWDWIFHFGVPTLHSIGLAVISAASPGVLLAAMPAKDGEPAEFASVYNALLNGSNETMKDTAKLFKVARSRRCTVKASVIEALRSSCRGSVSKQFSDLVASATVIDRSPSTSSD